VVLGRGLGQGTLQVFARPLIAVDQSDGAVGVAIDDGPVDLGRVFGRVGAWPAASVPLVELARRAADPNPAVRLELAESLPTFSGVDARPWLLELSYDDDPRVRTAAVTLMATSGDIDLLKRVQQVSLDDPDDHTRAQAEKALPKQKRRY